MSVIRTAYSQNTIWNFVEATAEGPNWRSLAIDSNSTSSQINCSFQHSGQSVVLKLTGTFPANPASFASLNTLANDSSIAVTNYELFLGGAQFEALSMSPASGLATLLNAMDDTNRTAIEQHYAGNDVFIGSTQANTEGDDDGVNGYAGNDIFYGNATSGNSTNRDKFYGGDGIDTAVFRGKHADYRLGQEIVWMPENLEGPGWLVADNTAGRDGNKSLRMVERLQFSDINVAIDISGNAGKVAKILAAVFGKNAIQNEQYVGIGLDYVDAGMSYPALAALAITAAGKSTPQEIVTLLWSNLMGSAPTSAQAKPFIDLLNGGMSQGDLGVMAADYAATIGIVNMTTLGQTGLEFI